MSGGRPIYGQYPKIESEFPTAAAAWIELPADVTANIIKRLEIVYILEVAENVCTTWRRIICSDPSMWRVLRFKRAGFCVERIPNMLRRAVDRSQGQLVDLFFEDSWNGRVLNYNVLNYIVDRSSNLKRLTLEVCNGITGKAVAEAVNKLPHLEGLHLIDSPQMSASDIVKIGNACPLLKSFTFTQYSNRDEYSNRNECAVAIAKHMPNLYHLRLNSKTIDNEGLEAILDGCPNLETLYLPVCPELDLRGALGKRCSKQMKRVQFPFFQSALKSSLTDLLRRRNA